MAEVSSTTPAWAQLGCREASQLLSSGARPYLDVRTEEEFRAGHPPGAAHVPYVFQAPDGSRSPNPDFIQQVERLFPDRAAPLIVGCKSGRRSDAACAELAGRGYSQLENLVGGFDEWKALGLPAAGPDDPSG